MSSDDENGGSGTDDEHDLTKEQRAAKKAAEDAKIPTWAKGAALTNALRRQNGCDGHVAIDPDSIFDEVTTCNLVDIFGQAGSKKGSYKHRGSSAHWDRDQLTVVEKRAYRVQLGFEGI